MNRVYAFGVNGVMQECDCPEEEFNDFLNNGSKPAHKQLPAQRRIKIYPIQEINTSVFEEAEVIND